MQPNEGDRRNARALRLSADPLLLRWEGFAVNAKRVYRRIAKWASNYVISRRVKARLRDDRRPGGEIE